MAFPALSIFAEAAPRLPLAPALPLTGSGWGRRGFSVSTRELGAGRRALPIPGSLRAQPVPAPAQGWKLGGRSWEPWHCPALGSVPAWLG